VPSDQKGVYLGGLDVLNSAMGIVYPLLGGWIYGSFGFLGMVSA